MNRRSFLRFLGLAPVVPIALKVEPAPLRVRIVVHNPSRDLRADLKYARLLIGESGPEFFV